MDVVFTTKSKNQNRFTIANVEGHGRVFFDKGTIVTQDKSLIRKLLNHPLKKRGEYHLVTNEELVAKYLDGEDPDKLTRDIIDRITRQGIIELGDVLSITSKEPTIIKEEAIGFPITNAVQKILDFYNIEKTKKEALEEAKAEDEQESKPKRGRPRKTK